MAFDDASADSGTISQINVTPLVDVMLVLLIIFMVASPVLQQGVELELPKETMSPVQGDGEQLVVSVTSDGRVFLGKDNELSLTEIGPKLQTILQTRDDKRVFIKADKSVMYGRVMAVMARLRKVGIYKIGLLTDPSPESA